MTRAPMPETPDFPAGSLSSSGYGDGLGRRALAFDRETGGFLERLVLRPELWAFQGAIVERLGHAADFDDERFARLQGIERDPDSGAVVVVSEYLQGNRLSDLMDGFAAPAADGQPAPGLDAAIGYLLEVLPALSALHTTLGFAHGAIGPGRTVITPAGQVVLLDWIYGHALQRLGWTTSRLWRELGIVVPADASAGAFDFTADISQAALAAVTLVTGRPLSLDEGMNSLAGMVAEIIEVAHIRGSGPFAAGIQSFLQRTLPLPGRSPFAGADEAVDAVRRIADEIGLAQCRAALAGFAADSNQALESSADPIGLEADLDALAFEVVPDCESPVFESPREDEHKVEEGEAGDAARIASAALEFELDLDLDDQGPELAASLPAAAEPPVYDLGDETATWESSVSAAAPAPSIEVIEPAGSPPDQIPSQEADPIPVDPGPADTAAAAPLESMLLPPASPDPTRSEPAAAETPGADARGVAHGAGAPPDERPAPPAVIDPPVSSRKRRKKGGRNRGKAGAAPTPTPPIMAPPAEVTGAPPPRPSTPAPEAWPPAAETTRLPAAPAAMPYYPPVGDPREPLSPSWSASLEALAADPGEPPQPGPLAAPVRIKADAPSGYAPAPRYRELEPSEDVTGLPYVTRGHMPLPSSRWKIGAAAAVVVAALVVVVARPYLRSNGPAPSTAAAPDPAPGPVSPVAPSGSIALETKPAGAKVLVDGVPAGETPLTLEKVPVGRHVVTFVTASGSIRRNVHVEEGKTASLDVAVFSGWIAVFAPVVMDIAENGRSLGTSEDGRLMLPPGRHQLTFTNRDLGYSSSQAVDIQAGEERSINLQPTGALNLNALPWAEVWIDGKKVGDTPIAALRVPLGTHDVVFRHPQLGERSITTIVRADAPAAAAVDFTKSP